ncbi:MAG: hypothetical protein B6D42_06240 [Anaerolineae bacterium UTCFX5]|nr:MAG: hypothetical protein B6D42_06240 [Anaerolineae bacterium UTCFX5]
MAGANGSLPALGLPLPEYAIALDWLAVQCAHDTVETGVLASDARLASEFLRRPATSQPFDPAKGQGRAVLILPSATQVEAVIASPTPPATLLIVTAGALYRFISSTPMLRARTCLGMTKRQGYRQSAPILHLHGEISVLWSIAYRVYSRMGRDDLAGRSVVRTRESYLGRWLGTLALITLQKDV